MTSSISMLRAIAGLALAIPHQSAIEVPTIRDDGSPRKHGRPKIHADRPKPRERDSQYLKNRHKLLPKFLDELKVQRHEMNKAKRRKSLVLTDRQRQILDKYINESNDIS